MKPTRTRGTWIAPLLNLLALATFARDPYTPSAGDAVLVRLPKDQPRAAATFTNLVEALPRARESVRRARAEGDPRALGQAQALLRPWWGLHDAPADLLLVRAEIRQGLHDFPGAMADLALALQREPRHAGGWLTRATLEQLLGRYDDARRSCFQVLRAGDAFGAATASAALAGLVQEDGSPAIRELTAQLARAGAEPGTRQSWAWTTLGELQVLHGDPAGAERSFRQALESVPGAPYPTAALADLFLELDRPGDVLGLVPEGSNDLLRLRLAEARLRLAPGAPATLHLIQEIGEGFELARARGDDLHLREQARFELRIRGNARTALRLACRNWEIQKEPADLLLLLEASRAAADAVLELSMAQWAREHQPATWKFRSSRPRPEPPAPLAAAIP